MAEHEFCRSETDIFGYCRVKQYPSGAVELLACDKPIFGGAGWEECMSADEERRRAQRAGAPAQQRREDERSEAAQRDADDRARRRAASKVRDLALCNDFGWFVTLTLDAAKVDRYDMREITRKLNNWCDNMVRRKGLRYVLVPERHKDGAVHFHGFFPDGCCDMIDSGTLSGGPVGAKPRRPRSAAQAAQWEAAGAHRVYNVADWRLGFSTAIRLYGTYESAVAYVCKYVRKQVDKVGGRWYYSGGKLEKPEVFYPDVSYRELEAVDGCYRFEVPGRRFVMVRLRNDDGGC